MNELMKYSDAELAASLQAGDAAAFRVIYDRYWQLLFRFARKLLQDPDRAEDVVQECFTTLWDKRDRVNPDIPLAAFLYRLTRNKILDLIKHSKVETKYYEQLHKVIQLGDALPDELFIEKELYDQIEREIRNLPEKMRIIFEMSRKQHMTTQEIATELGIAEQTVKNQVSNAIRTLKGKLGNSLNIFLIFF